MRMLTQVALLTPALNPGRLDSHDSWTFVNERPLAAAAMTGGHTGAIGPSVSKDAGARSPFTNATGPPQFEAGTSMHGNEGAMPSPGTPSSHTSGFAITVNDLPIGMREEDLLASFLLPPPWPNEHPFALAHAHARRIRGDAVSPTERAGPAGFLSTRSARIMAASATASWSGIVVFEDENDCNRALIEMQGIVLAASGSGDARPVRISKATSALVPPSPKWPPSSRGNKSAAPGLRQQPALPTSLAVTAEPYSSATPATMTANGHSGALHPTPSPAEIALQSSTIPAPSPWGVPTLPGFPTVPATGVSGPVDVGLHPGTTFSSSYGGPAALTGTGFFLGPSTLPSPSSALDPNNTTVFVGGLSSMISEDILRTFFEPFGAIAYVKIPPGKGCGFVSFARKVDAERAIEKMQGFPVGGCRIRLSWGRSQGEKYQHLAQQQMAGPRQSVNLAGPQSPAFGPHQPGQSFSPPGGPGRLSGRYSLPDTAPQLHGGATPFYPQGKERGATQDFLMQLGEASDPNTRSHQLSSKVAGDFADSQSFPHNFTAPVPALQLPRGREIGSPDEQGIATMLGRIDLDQDPVTDQYTRLARYPLAVLEDEDGIPIQEGGPAPAWITRDAPLHTTAEFGSFGDPRRTLRPQASMEVSRTPLTPSQYADRAGRARTDTYPLWQEPKSPYAERPSNGFGSPEEGRGYEFGSLAAAEKQPHYGSTFAPFSPLVKNAALSHSPNTFSGYDGVTGPQIPQEPRSTGSGSSSNEAQSKERLSPHSEGTKATS